jgi:hypothetical protein
LVKSSTLRAAVDSMAVERRQQGFEVRRDDLDGARLLRFFLGEARRLPHDRLGVGFRSVVSCGERLGERHEAVGRFLLHRAFEVLVGADRMRRADARTRRHGGHIGGEKQECARRRRLRGRRFDEGDDRYRRVADVAHDVLHRGHEAAGRVERHQQEGRLAGTRGFERLVDVARLDGIDDALDADVDRDRGRRRARAEPRRKCQREHHEQPGGSE